ncbi:MAG: hypothetical protein ABI650_00420 [Dokdonella sp.]
MQTRNKKRLQLILIASCFFAPMLGAAVLALSGWVPDARSNGEGIVPQRTVDDVVIELADGKRLEWRDPDWRWSVVAIAGRTCADACLRQLDQIHRVRVSLNQKSSRVRLLYVGVPPQGEAAATVMPAWQSGSDPARGLAEWAPDVEDGVAAILVKPDGTALTVYRDGFNASGLRKDLAKVTR